MRRIAFIAAPVLAAVLALSSAAFAAAWGSSASGWHVASRQENANAPTFEPSFGQVESAVGGIASLNFTDQPNTTLLVTNQPAQFGSVLGDLTGRTVTANFTISGLTADATFKAYDDGCSQTGNGAPNARLFFETSTAGGATYEDYWWSNPAHAALDNGTFTVSAPVVGSDWSDWNGKMGDNTTYVDPYNGLTPAEGFAAASSHITEIGLSFGGGCHFVSGVGTTDGSGTLTLNSFTAVISN